MLKSLGVRSVQLMTNNPDKVGQLEKLGMRVVRRVELEAPANEHSRGYLDTKRDKMGHMIRVHHSASA
jgi:GTP cyclohydrolase II